MEVGRAVVVVVEGPSDVAVLEVLLRRRGQTSGVEVHGMGGVTNIRRALTRLLATSPAPRVLGLCDEGEAEVVVRAVAASGVDVRSVDDLPALGFHTCRADLEDELVRTLGPTTVLGVLDDLGLGAAFDRFRHEPAWRGRDLHESLVRFAGVASGRKVLFARALAEALDPDTPPDPLALLLEQVAAAVTDLESPPVGPFEVTAGVHRDP
ncbi:hypothetical protein [Oryzobacter telluris]|uniref:hypothetical protein n=1 Tax=Oryzobacter telluris TaxID=3149179 RepID=UPI00370DA6C6